MTDRGEFRDPFPPLLTGEESIDPSVGRIDWTRPIPQLRLSGRVWVAGEPAYLFKEQVIYTADGTFTKADYPLLRAIRVRLVGGGGQGGGAQTTAAGEGSIGNGGAAGAYVEKWILADDLDATEAVTVGQGGDAATTAATGEAGTDSVFDTISGEVRAPGGPGGLVRAASSTGGGINRVNAASPGSTGDINIGGEDGGIGISFNNTLNTFFSGQGGASMLGPGGPGRISSGDGLAADGNAYGAGGGGAGNGVSQATPRKGGDGFDGIVIVDVYV